MTNPENSRNEGTVPGTGPTSSNPPRTSSGLFVRRLLGVILGAALIAIVASSVVFVDEAEYVLVERLGIITAVYDNPDPVAGDRGLHFKLPWPLETVRRFDRRLQLFDPPGREMFTSDKKNITVDSYICWRIAEPPKGENVPLSERPVVRFFRGLGNVATTEARLDTRVRSILSSEMGNVDLGQLLQVADSESGPSGDSPIEELSRRVLNQVRQRPDEKESVQERLGIEVVDVGLKRINLPEANLFAVYERMRKEREKIAQRYRSAGEAEKLVIESQARRQREEILARAGADAERIRGEGEAEAIGIRNAAHAQDPEFYKMLRTLEGYRKILNGKTTLVLSSTSSLLKLLTEGLPTEGEASEPPTPPGNALGAPRLPGTVGGLTPPAAANLDAGGAP